MSDLESSDDESLHFNRRVVPKVRRRIFDSSDESEDEDNVVTPDSLVDDDDELSQLVKKSGLDCHDKNKDESVLESDSSFENHMQSLQINDHTENRTTQLKQTSRVCSHSNSSSNDLAKSKSVVTKAAPKSASYLAPNKDDYDYDDSFIVVDSSVESEDDSDLAESETQSKEIQVSREDECAENETSAWKFDPSSSDYYLQSTSSNGARWPKICLPKKLFLKLFSYQRDGVQFLASLHEDSIGGILGDDMGMGKTFMTTCYLGGLFRARTIRNALIVAPLSVLRSWQKEAANVFDVCDLKVHIHVLSSDLTRQRRIRLLRDALHSSTKRPYFVITTYAQVRELTSEFVDFDNSYWDYVVLDEGHTIKNHKTKISASCRRICVNPKTHRLMLSGTPIMNNLQELWSVFDWATSGRVLGTSSHFNSYFAKPIECARNKTASNDILRTAGRVNKELQTMLKPYFLQRLKADYLQDQLSTKNEIVIWTHLSSQQRSMYTEFVTSGDSVIKMILRGEKTSPLQAITWLKKLCGHPLIANKQGDVHEELETRNVVDLIKSSAKLQILVSLIEKLSCDGHRTLIFSQSTRMLDIIQKVLSSTVNIKLARIDGGTKEQERQIIVDTFNHPCSNLHVLLLSTKAAGVGLTLTGADRVVVYDPSWTPAEDSQAVDRCFRIGQKKPVLVFRMIAAGTIEEKMYEKQIHKDGIRRTVFTEGKSVQRYFDAHELRKFFQLGEPGVCEVMDRVHDVKTDWSTYKFLLDHHGVVGLSRHDGFYNPADVTPVDVTLEENDVVYPVVGKAQRVLQNVINIDDIPNYKTTAVTQTRVKANTAVSKENVASQDNRKNSNKHNVRCRKEVAEALSYAKSLDPKHSLQFLLDMLDEIDELDPIQEHQLHRQIAFVSNSLNLLD